MRIGDACGLFHLLLSGIVYTESDVVAERIVEKDGLLVDVSYQLTQVVEPQVLDVDAVDKHLSLLHIVVTGYQVDHCRLAAAALPHQRNGLSLGYDEVDVLENPLLSVAERHVAELYLMVE